MVEDDISLVLDECNSTFNTLEIEPGIYTFKYISETLFNILHPKHPPSSDTIVIELDDIASKTKLVVRSGIIAIRFDEESFFSTILGFNHGWVYKHYNEHTSQKIVNLSNPNKIHLECDVIDGSVVNGSRQPLIYSFVSDKPSYYKVFCEPVTIQFKKMNKSVLNTITFYLEEDDNEEVNFNGKTLNFALQLIEI